MDREDLNVVALVKGEERYIFLFRSDQRDEMLRTLGRFAFDKNLSFTWRDAAALSPQVRKQTKEPIGGPRQ